MPALRRDGEPLRTAPREGDPERPDPDGRPPLAELVARAHEDDRERPCALCLGEDYGDGWRHERSCPMA